MSDFSELLKIERSVSVQVSLLKGPLDQLVYLLLAEISPNDHPNDDLEVLWGYKSIPVMIVKIESKFELVLLFALLGEMRDSLHELHKGDFSVLFLIDTSENLDCQGVVFHLRNLEELVKGNVSFVVSVKDPESLENLIDLSR